MSNKSARDLLEIMYGKKCMFLQANLPERLKGMTIKGYKKFVEEQHYTSKQIKKLERIITYHHLKHISEGGKTTIRNGALVNELAHRYIHSLDRDEEEIINNMLREYKDSLGVSCSLISTMDKTLEAEESIKLNTVKDGEEFLIISLEDITPEISKKRFNRAKAKEDIEKAKEEGLEEYYNEDEGR